MSQVRATGLIYHDIPPLRERLNPLREARAVGALVALYRRVRPDIVHHVTIKPVLYGGVAARIVRIPAVVSAISGLGFVFVDSGVKARTRRAMVLAAYRVALDHPNSCVIVQNEDDGRALVSAGAVTRGQLELVPGSGVDLGVFHPGPEPPGPPVVLFPGRLLRHKGFFEFVEAARVLRSRGVPARFVLAGDVDAGNPSSVTREEVERLQHEGMVDWVGHRLDMAEVLRQSHIVCLPSYREGLSLALLEAAAAGIPVVTTDTPGCRDAVKPGLTGLVVPPRDGGAVADAVQRLLDAPAERRVMGERARAWAEERFGTPKVVAQTLAVYARLTDRSKALS